MSIWKDNTARQPSTPALEPKEPVRYGALSQPEFTPSPIVTPAARADAGLPRQESLIAADITIEGKIEGGGSIRIAGKFKGDVAVQGDLTIEAGAKLSGSVRADKVTIDLLKTGVVIGELKAGSHSVAAGARMRGQAEFGWDDDKAPKAGKRGNGHGAEIGTGS